MNTIRRQQPCFEVALALAAALALLTAGCAEGPAGGAHPAAVSTTAVNTAAAVAATDAARTNTAPLRAEAGQPNGAATLSPSAKAPVVLVADKRPAPTGQVRDITFDTIKFPMDKKDLFKRSMLTPKIEELAGNTVRIRGYILPTPKQRVTHFILVRDNKECCFGPGAALYDCVSVELEPGQATEYSLWPVAVEGVFDVRVMPGPDDRPLAIYHLQATSVK